MSDCLPIYSVNGKLDVGLSPLDRGLAYGDGLFETIRVQAFQMPLWPFHQARLVNGCRRLSISLAEQYLLPWTEELLAAARNENRADGVLKIIVTRGAGGRGYAYGEDLTPTVIMIFSALPSYPEANQRSGVALFNCSTTLGINPALAGLKHLNKLEHVLARAEWQSPEFAEGLLRDTEGRVVEGTVSNVFAVKDHQLFTPVLTRCGVSGIMRRLVCEQLAPEVKLPLIEQDMTLEQLYSADEVFVTNSVFGIWPVCRIGEQAIKRGMQVVHLQASLLKYWQAHLMEEGTGK